MMATAPDLETANEGWLWLPGAGGTLIVKLAGRTAEQVVTAQ
jgi:hypothetical protein